MLRNTLEKNTVEADKLSKLGVFWINVIILLNFFPFFKFLPIDAEIQPIAAVIALVYLIHDLTKERAYIYRSSCLYLMVIMGYFMSAIVFYASGMITISYIFQSMSVLLAPLSVFLVMFDRLGYMSVGIFRWSFYSWFGVCFLQTFATSVLNATGISFVLTNAISRFEASAHSNGRGVAGFAPEPSYAAHVIILMMLFAIFLYRKKRISAKEVLIMIAMSLFMIIANQSTTLGSFFTTFVCTYAIWEIIRGGENRIKFTIGLFLFFIVGIIGVTLFKDVLIQVRFFSVFFEFADLISFSDGKSFSATDFSESYGSVRAIAVKFGYEVISLTHGMGLGIGGYGSYSVPLSKISNAGKESPILFVYGDDVPIRPLAYASFVAMEMGALGLLSLSFMFLKLIKIGLQRVKKVSPFAVACFCLFFFGVYYNQPGSLPAHWLMLLLAIEDGTVWSDGIDDSDKTMLLDRTILQFDETTYLN